jgi:hypothetical protein
MKDRLATHRVVKHRMQGVLEWLFGCWHLHASRPFTISGRTYEVCLDCGREFPYARIDFSHRAAACNSETSSPDAVRQQSAVAIVNASETA